MEDPLTTTCSLDLETLITRLRTAYSGAPFFGSITISAYFTDGRLARIEQGQSESTKAFSGVHT
jgi:hypothetical protein